MAETPFLIVGLGNPGSKYEKTRHNVGFQVIDELERRWKETSSQEKFDGLLTTVQKASRKIFLLRPQTFMNRSGLCVTQVVGFFKIPPDSVLVVSDDVDIPLGTLRLRPNGGSGGHNGMKSIIESLGTEDFPRLRIGIGRSATVPTDVHVLGKIAKDEEKTISEAVKLSADGIERILKEGVAKAMNVVNQKRSDES